ncbi:antA/AntB antirepressor family protein [Corynebacterium sp. H128]|uniref:antA/AntB antirepressor family protein n=1 Tax=Corynebacterium sp. H128 TaxID=3133427 RepID=UPI003097EF01
MNLPAWEEGGKAPWANYHFLEITTPYPKWFSRMVDYGFVAGQDFAENSVKPIGAWPLLPASSVTATATAARCEVIKVGR